MMLYLRVSWYEDMPWDSSDTFMALQLCFAGSGGLIAMILMYVIWRVDPVDPRRFHRFQR